MAKTLLLIIGLTGSVALMGRDSNPIKRLSSATEVIGELMRTPEKSIPQELFDDAECAIVVPGLKKGAFGFGGKYGRGFASCRKPGAGWSSPAAVAVEGGSFGLQLGGSS